jgi:hypothetical protein
MIGVGVLLLLAAGLKFAGLAFSPVPAVGEFSSPRLGIAIASWEVLLGVWLLTLQDRQGWCTALLTFLVFGFVSGYMSLIGVSSCGCFGSIHTSPWVPFGLDLFVVTFLLLNPPSVSAEFSIKTVIRPIALGVVCLFAVAIAILMLVPKGTFSNSLAALRGETIVLSAYDVDFGNGKAGDTLNSSVSLTNYSDSPVRLIGGTSDCSCTTIGSLPLIIESGGTQLIPMQLTIPAKAYGKLTKSAWFVIDEPGFPRIRFQIGCTIK